MEEFIFPEDYTFNESQKRLEPIEKKCAFCNKAQFEKVDDCYFAPVFMTKDRTYLVVYSSVKYAKILIGIPRCKSCKKIHGNAKALGTVIAIIIAITIVVLGIMIMTVPTAVIGVFGGAFAGVFGAIYFTDQLITRKGIKTLKEAAKENELVKKFLNNGWSLKQPEP